ncbi:MAG: glycosyltransferase family 4 protein [Prevotella sp.]|nr:glycosyltransferase family 4 protein [Prevotella sp.]
MPKILLIRENLKGGTDNYCKVLHRLLGHDNDCQVLPVTDIPHVKSALYHYKYEEQVLRPYIEQADIVHVNGYTAQGTIDAMRLAHRLGKKIVYTGHWHPFSCLRHPALGKLFFNMKMKRAIMRYADVVTTINNEDTRFFSSFFPNVVQIPHPLNEQCRTDEPSEASIGQRDPQMILFVGRIDDPVKGFEQIYALPEGHYHIHCVGKGVLPAERSDITHHVNIPTEELTALYQKASLLVVPSKYEAFCFVALEALSQGVPVVMSERVRIADYLTGTAGWAVYRYGDTKDFIAKVEQTLGQTVSIDRIRHIFDPQAIAGKYKQIYLEVRGEK